MAYTVAITNQKGGVGKTTTAVNLAAALAIAERRTLLVDADPQGNTTSGVGIAKMELQVSLYDALVDDHPVHDVILPVPGLRHLSVLPATQDLVGAELQLVERPFRESALRRVLEPLEADYDYIVVDCPPSLGLLTLNVLAAVQQLIIPIQCEYYGLEGISQLLNTVRLVQQNINPGLAIGGVLLTMYDSRLNLCRQVAEDATEYFGSKVFAAPIPRNVRLAEAPSFGKPILLYDVQSVGAKSYLAVAQELLRRVEGAEVTIAPAQVAAATAHAVAAAAVGVQTAEPASDEAESGEVVAAEEVAPPEAAMESLPAEETFASEETFAVESQAQEPPGEEVAVEKPALGASDPPLEVSSSVEEDTPTSPEELASVEAPVKQETVTLASSGEIVSQGEVAAQRVQAMETLPGPEFVDPVEADGSQASPAEISESVSAAASHNGTDPSPVESGDDEANRQPHQSSESKPEVTT